MAEVWTSLKEVRLKLSDPSGVIGLETVTAVTDLPDPPERQTVYRVEETGEYRVYDNDLGIWETVDLELSDERLNNLISLYGSEKAVLRAITAIIASLRSKIKVARSSAGGEATEFTSLVDTLAFYTELRNEYEIEKKENAGVSTGRMIFTTRPVIGGIEE